MSVHQHEFSFPVGNESLSATIDYCGDIVPRPATLSLHGGGPGGRQRIVDLSSYLAKQGYPVLRFDHSGHGDSTGILAEASLKKRYDEAMAALEFMDVSSGITLIATSMGGAIALEMLPHINVKNLILFCPAAYAAEAFDVPFGHGFTEIIRQPDSYRAATIFENLKNYTGRLLLVTGSADEIIPSEITHLYDESSTNCIRKDVIVVDGAVHALHRWFPDHPVEQARVYEKVLDCIRSSTRT